MLFVGTFRTCRANCQINEERRISRLGAQVVKINADLLHFHSIPSALESRIGGADLVGSRIAALASTTNVTATKDRFIDATPIFNASRLNGFEHRR